MSVSVPVFPGTLLSMASNAEVEELGVTEEERELRESKKLLRPVDTEEREARELFRLGIDWAMEWPGEIAVGREGGGEGMPGPDPDGSLRFGGVT